MIIVTDCSKDIKIPAGLGDNAGVVYETTGVKSVNGEQGDVTLKTVNGETLTGEGNIEIQAGVTSVNGQTGDLNLKTVNGNDLLGEGNIEIQAGVTSVNGQTGDLNLKTVNGNDLLGEGNIEIQAGVTSVNGQTGDVTVNVPTVPTKVSELQNDADYQNGEQVADAAGKAAEKAAGNALTEANSYTDEAIKNIPSGYTAGGKKIVLNDLTQDEYKAIREKVYAEMKASGHTEDTYYYKNDEAQSIEITSINYEEENNTVTNVEFDGFTANLDRWKFSINADNEFNVIENGSRAKITDIDWYPNSIATISFQVKMYGDDRDKDKGLFINTISSSMFNDTVYGTPFVIYFRAGFGDTSMFTTGAVAYNIDDDKYFEFIFKNYNYRYHLNGDYQIIAIEKEYIAFDDTTLCNVQADFSLSKEDTNISLYTYGVGSHKDNWDAYINGDYRTVQTLTVMPTDGSPRSKVPVTFDCMKDDKKAVFYFELHGYRYTYTQVEGNSWKFTSKEKIVTPADIANKVTSTSISNIVVLSQTEYDALGTKDANTMYCIKD